MNRVMSYASTLMGVLLIVALGAWTVVTLQINTYLLPQEVGTGDIHPLYQFPEATYYLVLMGLAILMGMFLVLGALLRREPPSLPVESQLAEIREDLQRRRAS